MDEMQPEEKASAAAEALAAEGVAVTARAVRERSGVRMAVATDAARHWNEVSSAQQSVPEPPDAVRRRFDAIWAEAFVAARTEFDEARTGWLARVGRLEEEIRQLAAAVEDAEQATERVQVDADAAADRAAIALAAAQSAATGREQELTAELATANARADQAQGALGAVTDERDRLLREVAGLRGHTEQ